MICFNSRPHRALLIFALLTIVSAGYAQRSIVKDSLPDASLYSVVRNGDFLYTCGVSTDKCREAGFVSKISLADHTVKWRITEPSAVPLMELVFYKVMFAGSSLFAFAYNDIYGSDYQKITRIDPESGTVLGVFGRSVNGNHLLEIFNTKSIH